MPNEERVPGFQSLSEQKGTNVGERGDTRAADINEEADLQEAVAEEAWFE